MKLTLQQHRAILNGIPNTTYHSIMEIKLLALKAYYSKSRFETLDDEDEEAIASLAMEKFSDQNLPYDDVDHPVVLIRPGDAGFIGGKPKKSGGGSSSGAAIISAREAEQERLRTAAIYYDDHFWDHIFQGESLSGDGAHTGLHSLALRDTTGAYPVVTINATDSLGCYTASVKLTQSKAAKTSSFFPATWGEDNVKKFVAEAIRDSWLNPTAYDDKKRAAGLTWVGVAMTPAGPMFIGGIGGKGLKSSDRIATAFPAVNNTFT